MSHLGPEQLVDALEGALTGTAREHLAACGKCQREVVRLAGLLEGAREAGVPEPSPLFWSHFSDRVRAAIEADDRHQSRRATWRWLVAAPLGALTAVAIAVALTGPRRPLPEPDAPQAQEIAPGADVATSDASTWALITDLVGDLDWDTASAAGLALPPGLADEAAAALSPGEQQELTRLLRVELERPRS